MQIILDEGYNAMCDFVYLGYVGEVNAREISVLNYAIPEATAYKLKIEYPDKTVYELPIKNGVCSLGASIFKTACEVKCQIVAYAVEGEVYKLVRKSDIFKQEIRSSIDESGIPSYEESLDALDKILQYESNSKEYAERAEQARDTAVSAKERAVSAENTAVQKADEADKSAQSAKNSEQNAAKSAERAESVAEVATASANQARDYAKEAAKAATNAGLSADTATQAASRAETAKTSAETSATQADTAMQGAETARAEAVKSQNDAKVSAAQASTSAQQTTADKNITAGYAKTAKTNADSTAADRQAVQTLAEQVTADKAIVAENAAKVAEDRTAAETAAQTAQAVADSLPDDYTTAVGKIAENTAEIGRVKLTDKELQRRVNALYDMGNGVTHKFETDSETAYQKAVPTGAKLMSVKSIGGHSEVIDGEIVSAGTEEIVEQGKNLFDIEKCVKLNSYYGFEIDTNKTLQIDLKDGKTCPTNVSFGIVYVHGNTMANWLITSNGVRETITNSRDMTDSTQIMVACYPGNKETMQSIADAFDIMLVDGIYKSDTMPAYAPYHSNVYQIPEAIRNLPGYGWSAGTAKNYVDYENKKYVQCVDSVDLGALNWVAGDSGKVGFQTSQVKGQKLTKNYTISPNFLCSKYSTKTQNEVWGKTNVTGITADANTDGYIYVNDTSYTDVTAFKQAMQGVILYYELANPIVTDISTLIDDDFLRNIEVEAGGSVTFKGGNDDYRIPVPSEEEYIVKLSEVGGTT